MKKIIAFIFCSFFLISGFSYYSIFISKKNLNTSFIVNNGEVTSQISKNLEEQKIINNDFWFNIYSKIYSKKTIKSGKHILLGSYTIPEVLNALISNPEPLVKTKKITIPEGWTKYNISQYLSKNIDYKYDEILKFIDEDYKNTILLEKYKFINIDNVFNLEGYLYPDTYEIFENATLDTIFSKMLANFETKIIKKYKITDFDRLYDIVKMASVIEKEAKLDEDRPIVASVINNRLYKNMRLEMDSTVVYFTGNKEGKQIAEDKWIENDYNTYRKWGLPIGPISNPGLASIDAVINPAKTNYYYFVNKKTGEAVFSKTIEEHQINIQKYLW